MNMNVVGRGGAGQKTETADTAIVQLLPPRRGCRTVLDKIVVTVAGTAHTLTAMQALGKTTLSAAAAAAQAVINLTANPGPTGNALAAGDYVVVEKPDGTYHVGVVDSIATLAVTLTANVPTGGFASGARVWMFGVTTDTVPYHGGTHPQYPLGASADRTYDNASGHGVIGGNYNYEPVLLHINNATAASTIKQVSWIYTADWGSQIPPLREGENGGDQDEMPLAEELQERRAA